MSEFASAERVAQWTQPRRPAPFTAWDQALRAAFPVPEDDFVAPLPPVDVDAVRAEAFDAGYAEGLAVGVARAEEERAACRRLAAALDALRPEPTPALGSLIAATVERLLGELVGRVGVDRDLLLARAQAAAALIGEETRPATLRLHPDDLARLDPAALPVAVEADATVAPGSLRLETAGGWIEDGPAIRMERLRAALDQVAGSR